MEEIELIIGDSSSIWEFSNKQIDTLDNLWEGSWVVASKLGGTPLIQGNLLKNQNILNDDALTNEEFRKTHKIFEPNPAEVVTFNEDVISGNTCTVSGKVAVPVPMGNDLPSEGRYITVTIKGIFSGIKRDIQLKTNAQGEFSYDFNIGKTVKTPANSFFLFQIMPLESQQLEMGTYILSVEIRQLSDQGVVEFRREVLHAKLKMKEQGVL
jgi:hypothetical protein